RAALGPRRRAAIRCACARGAPPAPESTEPLTPREDPLPRLLRDLRIALPGAFLLFAAAGPAPAQDNPVPAWEAKMTQAEQQLRQGDYKKAKRTLREVVGQMGETLGTGPAAA